MDFNQYYLNQAKNLNQPVFRGSTYQRGYGFGDIFKKFFSFIMPLIRKNATPVLKNLGRHVIKTASNIANDVIDGKNLSERSNYHINDSLNNLRTHYGRGKKN